MESNRPWRRAVLPDEGPQFRPNVTVQYEVIDSDPPITGSGRLVALDNCRVCFTTIHPLNEGTRLQAVLEWPGAGKTLAMKLVASGTITRVEARIAILLMEHYKFLSGEDEVVLSPIRVEH